MAKEKPANGHKVEGRWIIAPLSDILTPMEGRVCMAERWWAVTPEGNVLFFDTYHSPQCNRNKSIADRLGKSFNAPPTAARFVDMAFVPQSSVE